MGTIDTGPKFTGGLKIIFKKTEERYCSGMSDESWGRARIGNIALQDQPLSAFVEAALCEKGLYGRSYQIVEFAPEISLIIVNADLTSRNTH